MTKQHEALLFANNLSIMKLLTEMAIAKEFGRPINSKCLIDPDIIEQTQLVVIELTKEKETKPSENNADLNIVFLWWNMAKGWQTHEKITPHAASIRALLKQHNIEEIKKAISNYALVVDSEETYYSHRYTLKDFLKRGLLNFLDTAEPFKNYRLTNGNQTTTNASISNERATDVARNAIKARDSQLF